MEKIRHSLAHLLAIAVKELYPKAKLGMGPAIDNGFYYDFDNLDISEKDLKRVEKKMKELIKKDLKFKSELVTKDKAKKLFKGEKYKLELIKELKDYLDEFGLSEIEYQDGDKRIKVGKTHNLKNNQ